MGPAPPGNLPEMRRLVIRLCVFVFGLSFVASALAQPGMDKDPLSFDRQIRPLLRRHCYRCHNADESSGDVNLQRDENPNLMLTHRMTWTTALEMVESGQMPPSGERFLKDSDRQRIIEFLTNKLSEFDCESLTDPGSTTARRLTRRQYDHAIADLTGLSVRPGDEFSPDATSYGFAGIGEAMGLSPVQVQQYEHAARSVSEALVACRETDPESFRRAFGDPTDVSRKSAQVAIEAFARRAFRRPVEDHFVVALMGIYDVARDQNADHVAAIGHALRAVMMSPRFFMRVESPRPHSTAETPYLVDDYDLASRLSFLIWSAPPDQPLLDLARSGTLNETENLVEQTKRMLADRRVEDGLVHEFFGQWLRLHSLESHSVDAQTFPGFDVALRDSMVDEAYAMLTHMIREDRAIDDLVDARFTFLNERLAAHYEIADVQGDKLRRIELPDRRRGGLLTTGAILTLQSDPGRTNVPRRGNYLAGTFLGTPAPPPPPDVPPLDDVVDDGKPRTLRQLLEEHRKNTQCAACHARMDPLGFALENYDAIGRWRELDAGQSIDASGVLPGGKRIDGPIELKDLLLSRRDDLARSLTEKLVIYSVGRGRRDVDECTIRDALAAAKANDYRFSSIVIEVVKSFPFRYRMDPQF